MPTRNLLLRISQGRFYHQKSISETLILSLLVLRRYGLLLQSVIEKDPFLVKSITKGIRLLGGSQVEALHNF